MLGTFYSRDGSTWKTSDSGRYRRCCIVPDKPVGKEYNGTGTECMWRTGNELESES